MYDALRKKLNGTYFKVSLAMRASAAQLLNMNRKDMMDFIAAGARLVDRMELEAPDDIETSDGAVDAPKEI